MTTTGQQLLQDLNQEDRERRLLQLHEDFRRRYAPEDADERDRFEAHLAMLLREVAVYATGPFQEAAARALAAAPMPPLVIPKPTK